MAACTDSLATVTDFIFTLLDTNKATFTPAVQAVYFGDQKQIPVTPAITVAAGQKMRSQAGAPRRVVNNFEVYVNIFFSGVRGVELNHRDADQLAEAVEAMIHQDIVMGGLVVNSIVALNEAGFLNKDNSQFRGNRLVVQAMSKTLLPLAPGYNQP